MAKIELDEKDSKKLLEMLCLAEWMMTAQYDRVPEKFKPYTDLIQKLINHNQKLPDFSENFHWDENYKTYFVTEKFQNYLHERFIDPYENFMFWDTLVAILAERDLVEQMGRYQYQNMDDEERENKLNELENRYRNEFIQNGTKNLKLNIGAESA